MGKRCLRESGLVGTVKTQMTHRIILTALLLLLSGCQKTPEQARMELAELGIEFSPSVFHESVENSDVVVVELFLTAGMNPDLDDVKYSELTPLMQATLKNHLAVVRVLLGWGAEINAQDSNGKTALDLATEQGHNEMVRLLVRAREGWLE